MTIRTSILGLAGLVALGAVAASDLFQQGLACCSKGRGGHDLYDVAKIETGHDTGDHVKGRNGG